MHSLTQYLLSTVFTPSPLPNIPFSPLRFTPLIFPAEDSRHCIVIRNWTKHNKIQQHWS